MKPTLCWKWVAQCIIVLACAFVLKQFYSTANVNELRWILAPTAAVVEVVTSRSFAFEPYAGYISEDRSFLIASSCAGVNFLITAFLMLSGRRLLSVRSEHRGWAFLPAAAGVAYLVTLVANSTRICLSLWLQPARGDIRWLEAGELHRLEGIVVYFMFLLLLFELNEKASGETRPRQSRWSFFPLVVYYATMLGIPIANGAFRQGAEFWEYALFVALIPLILIFSIAAFRSCRQRVLCRDSG